MVCSHMQRSELILCDGVSSYTMVQGHIISVMAMGRLNQRMTVWYLRINLDVTI